MPGVLIVAGDKSGESFRTLLAGAGYDEITRAASGGEARRIISRADFELVIINTPLSDEYGRELASFACENTGAGVLLAVRAEDADELADEVGGSGVFVLPKPVGRQFFWSAVRMACAVNRRLESRVADMKREKEKLEAKLEELRVVDRAKWALIQYLNMTEPQAHRYIEKQAMDMRSTRRAVAENIIKTYTNTY